MDSSRDFRRHFFEYVWDNPTVSDLLLSHSFPDAIICLSKTCRAARLAIASYCSLAFDVNRHLASYFDDPLEFRRLQQRTGTLVSGSSAVQFMGRLEEFFASDLDVYVDVWGAHEVGEWLQDNGYVYCPREAPGEIDYASFSDELAFHIEEYFDHASTYEPDLVDNLHGVFESQQEYDGWRRGVDCVFDFIRPGVEGVSPERKVQVITARRCPMQIILQYHSTCVMNFISHSKAVSLYPRATFCMHKSLISYEPSSYRSSLQAARAKWEARGWEMVGEVGEQCTQSPFYIGRRNVGDRRSWTIELDTNGLAPDAALDPLTINSWFMERTRQKRLSKVNLKIVYSPTLRHAYVQSPTEDFLAFMRQAVSARESQASRTGDWDPYIVPDASLDVSMAVVCNAYCEIMGIL